MPRLVPPVVAYLRIWDQVARHSEPVPDRLLDARARRFARMWATAPHHEIRTTKAPPRDGASEGVQPARQEP